MKYAEYVNRLFAKSAKRGIPLSGTFELTARCNLRCRMCYIHREENDGEIKTDEFSSEEWLNIAKEAQQCGMLFLLLTGGEPFIRPDFEEIYLCWVGSSSVGLGMGCSLWATMAWISSTVPPSPR